MNSRSQTFELKVEGRQIDEAVACLFHTVLFHRTLGKFTFEENGAYSMGTVGYQDVDCDFIDITYVCCSSYSLDSVLKKEISKFSDSLRRDNHGSGQISLEFFQKRKSHWPFPPESIPWEVWNVRIELLKLCNENDRLLRNTWDVFVPIHDFRNMNDLLADLLANDFLSQQSELEFIFDTSYPDVQPYLFKLGYVTSDTASPSVGYTVRKLIKETLSL